LADLGVTQPHLKAMRVVRPPPNWRVWGWPNHLCGPCRWFGHPYKVREGEKKNRKRKKG